uniref:Transmembrane protein 273 n=1 Tax=Myotis lucifugus TaxID=59463 RepID=G1Q1E6_MYOLU
FSFFADVGGAQVLATGKSTGAETDIKYALIGTALGVAISAGFLALKICMIRKHLFDFDSSDLRSANVGVSGQTSTSPKGLSSCSSSICPDLANSSSSQSGTFPSMCLVPLGNDFFPFCHRGG